MEGRNDTGVDSWDKSRKGSPKGIENISGVVLALALEDLGGGRCEEFVFREWDNPESSDFAVASIMVRSVVASRLLSHQLTSSGLEMSFTKTPQY